MQWSGLAAMRRILGWQIVVAPAFSQVAASLQLPIAGPPRDDGDVLELRISPGMRNLERTLSELGRRHPRAAPSNYPPPFGLDGGGAKQLGQPVRLLLDLTQADDARSALLQLATRVDEAIRPVVREHVDALAKMTPISRWDMVPDDQRARVAAAVPNEGLARPARSRWLLVLDLALNGSFYHGSTPLGNLSVQLMSERTGAFTPVFSNDLANLHYPTIKRFDAVFLNQIQGDVFDDDLAIDGLTRFVREGAASPACTRRRGRHRTSRDLASSWVRPPARTSTTASWARFAWTIRTAPSRARSAG
jgi:hypothetical protein